MVKKFKNCCSKFWYWLFSLFQFSEKSITCEWVHLQHPYRGPTPTTTRLWKWPQGIRWYFVAKSRVQHWLLISSWIHGSLRVMEDQYDFPHIRITFEVSDKNLNSNPNEISGLALGEIEHNFSTLRRRICLKWKNDFSSKNHHRNGVGNHLGEIGNPISKASRKQLF